jgi:hypothetical protein
MMQYKPWKRNTKRRILTIKALLPDVGHLPYIFDTVVTVERSRIHEVALVRLILIYVFDVRSCFDFFFLAGVK